MGHFGRKPIQLAWYGLVLPGLLLNYFGQAALLAAGPARDIGDLQAVLRHGARLGDHAARDPGHDGDGDRLAGA